MLNYPSFMSEDTEDYIYIADTSKCRIRKIDASGIITTVAGNGWGPGRLSQIQQPGERTC